MEPRTLCFITVFVGTCALCALGTPVAVTEASTAEEQKILLDCQHSDYRTYIKCLKRQKRHHLQHGDNHLEIDGHCMEDCLKKCEPDNSCDKKCNHCLKRTKHKHQIITEYETECASGNCDSGSNDGLPTTNITTNIDINNVINTGASTSTSTPCTPGSTNGTNCGPTCNPPIPCGPSYNPPYPPIFPQLTLVPQLTFGLSLGPIGGCAVPNQWPCVQQPPYQQPPGIDCSGCGNPFLRYRCDVSCYPVRNSNPGTPCTSPYCVGGTP